MNITRNRNQFKRQAEKCIAEKDFKGAQDAFRRAVDISPQIAQNLIQVS